MSDLERRIEIRSLGKRFAERPAFFALDSIRKNPLNFMKELTQQTNENVLRVTREYCDYVLALEILKLPKDGPITLLYSEIMKNSMPLNALDNTDNYYVFNTAKSMIRFKTKSFVETLGPEFQITTVLPENKDETLKKFYTVVEDFNRKFPGGGLRLICVTAEYKQTDSPYGLIEKLNAGLSRYRGMISKTWQ